MIPDVYNQRQKNIKFFFSALIILVITSLIFVYSASSIFALEKYDSAEYFLKKQLIGLSIALIVCFFFQKVHMETFRFYAPILFAFFFLITLFAAVSSYGIKIHGSQRWISFWGTTMVQPSEFLKTVFVLYFVSLLEKFSSSKIFFSMKEYTILILLTASTAGVLLLQPDFGQALVIICIALILFFIVNRSTKPFLYMLGSFIPIVCMLIVTKSYRLKRVFTFLNPWKDPQGAGFQIIQSLIAIGSGGVAGIGISQSKQKYFYLPMQHTDFIFSIIAEETGFIGATITIVSYFALLYYGICLAHTLKNGFYSLVIIGYMFLISLQVIINIFVVTGLFPTKGICLPFMSYGNSSLIAHFCMIGIVMSCYKSDR